jgi:hypothetical protein
MPAGAAEDQRIFPPLRKFFNHYTRGNVKGRNTSRKTSRLAKSLWGTTKQ